MTWTPRNIWIASGIALGLLLIITVIVSLSEGAFTPAMTISSKAFPDGGAIPSKYSCDTTTELTSPPLTIKNVPKNATSVVLYIYDQDVPKGGFVHWVVYNIDPKLTDLPEGQIPNGSEEGLNGGNKLGYVAFCPPTGKHRYLFTAYAVSGKYKFVKTPTIDQLKKVMRWQVFAKATMTGTYTRP